MITKMTRFNMKDFNKPNEPFVVSGRIIPSFENNVWTYIEEIFAGPYVSTCHFYAKNNFVIGAVDIMLYSNF